MPHSTTILWPPPHVSQFSDTYFDALRSEPKKKTSATRNKEKMGHIGRQYELVAAAHSDRHYRLFVRQSTANKDVFSVGLTLLMPENDLILCRYNSGHHGHRNILEKEKLAAACHQHVATQRYIQAGLDVDGFAITRTDYNSVDGALRKLVQECNIEGIFKPDSQIDLFQK